MEEVFAMPRVAGRLVNHCRNCGSPYCAGCNGSPVPLCRDPDRLTPPKLFEYEPPPKINLDPPKLFEYKPPPKINLDPPKLFEYKPPPKINLDPPKLFEYKPPPKINLDAFKPKVSYLPASNSTPCQVCGGRGLLGSVPCFSCKFAR